MFFCFHIFFDFCRCSLFFLSLQSLNDPPPPEASPTSVSIPQIPLCSVFTPASFLSSLPSYHLTLPFLPPSMPVFNSHPRLSKRGIESNPALFLVFAFLFFLSSSSRGGDTGSGTISMQSHGAGVLSSSIEPGAKFGRR